MQKVIIDSVKENGKFYRIKNFIDIIDNPMVSSMETLLEQSNKNATQSRLVLEKKRKLEAWKIKFKDESKNKIRSFLVKTKSELYGEVASFAENHYDDKNAGNAWRKYIENYNLELKATDVLKLIETRCNNHLSEIAREIASELEFSNHVVEDKSLNMRQIIDGKRIWNWGVLLTSGGLSIAAVITGLCGLACAGPLGWTAIIVGGIGALFSFLFTDRNKQINDARQKLETKLKSNIDNICKQLDKTLQKCIDEILEKRVDLLCKEIQRILNVMFSLCDEQRKLAWGINHRILDLNKEIFVSALKLTGFDGLQYHVKDIARIPGQAILLKLPDGVRFPDDSKDKIHKLMREEVSFVFESDNKWLLLARILGKGIDRDTIKIEDKIGIAHIPIDKNNLFLVSRVRLAQQLTELLITR